MPCARKWIISTYHQVNNFLDRNIQLSLLAVVSFHRVVFTHSCDSMHVVVVIGMAWVPKSRASNRAEYWKTSPSRAIKLLAQCVQYVLQVVQKPQKLNFEFLSFCLGYKHIRWYGTKKNFSKNLLGPSAMVLQNFPKLQKYQICSNSI